MSLAILLHEKCPTGKHVGSVQAYKTGYRSDRIVIPWPLEYVCRCEEPRADR